jgi:hypothetical protein
MSSFSSDWLALREPFDAAARAPRIIEKLREQLAPGTEAAPQPVVDLGAGAGANLRYLAPRFGGAQSWRLLDHDAALLEAAAETTRAWAVARGAEVLPHGAELTIRAADFRAHVRCEEYDLSSAAAGIPLADVDLPPGVLVTASALLDLVSAAWLDALVGRCRGASAALCFALTYDGRTVCTPAEPEDADVLALFNHHQRRDKGFGPALGPRAAVLATERFAAAGYRLVAEPSDWVIGPEQRVMQQALVDGWLGAALEIAPDQRATLERWHGRRREHVAAGRSELRIGHVDLVGWL